jgi:hypothetical protein
VKTVGEKPLPGNGHDGRIQADKIEPNERGNSGYVFAARRFVAIFCVRSKEKTLRFTH